MFYHHFLINTKRILGKTIMFQISFRTKKLLEDANNLQKAEYYQNAILTYAHYLEHMLLSSAIIYHVNNPIKAQKFLDKILKLKDEERLNLGKVMKIVPDEVFTSTSYDMCDEVRKIRNAIGGHSYFAIGLGYKFTRIEEVNYYKKIIRRIYKIIKNDKPLPNVEYFLEHVHPLSAHSRLETIVTEVEQEIMKYICKKIEKLVIQTSKQIVNNSGSLDRLN